MRQLKLGPHLTWNAQGARAAGSPSKSICVNARTQHSLPEYGFRREAALSPSGFDVPLPASLLNIKTKSRSNPFPWRGQFSPQLVESLLRAYAPAGATVLDPFMGSGTVLVEAARLGLAAYGCEIHPAAFLLGRVYELCCLDQAERRTLLNSAESALINAQPFAFGLPLFRASSTAASTIGDGCTWIPNNIDPRVRMLIETLIVLCNYDLADYNACANKWATIRSVVKALPYSHQPVRAFLSDARAVPLSDRSIDFVLSSPPYINVFNYHQNSRAGIEQLGWKPLVVARSEIGSNRKFRQNRFLIVVQYCIDMAMALAELSRLCRQEARLILVVGRESNVHKTPFFNSAIIKRLATDVVGMRLCQQQERAFLNRFGQRIYEDLLHFAPAKSCGRIEPDIVGQARAVGKDALIEAFDRAPLDRRRYLRDAIDEAGKVEPSPIFEPTTAR